VPRFSSLSGPGSGYNQATGKPNTRICSMIH
jgi:hypothetical protein